MGSELGSDLGTSARRSSSLHLATPKIDGKLLVMEYPGRASRCPYEVCDFVTREVDWRVMDRMAKHLETKHGTMTKEDAIVKVWACSKCGFQGTGSQLAKVHFPKCTARAPRSGALSPSRALSVLVTPSPPPNPNNIMGRCDQTTIIPETQPSQMPSPTARQTLAS